MELQIGIYRHRALLQDKNDSLLCLSLSICKVWVMPKPWIPGAPGEWNHYDVSVTMLLKNERHSRGKRFLFLFVYA